MSARLIVPVGICIVLAVMLVVPSLTSAADPPELAPRAATYEIDVRLDPATRMLTGKQLLTWRNLQSRATDEVRFHLYWNGWRNERSTWMREGRLRDRDRDRPPVREEDWGWIEVDSIVLPGGGAFEEIDLTARAEFIAPDDGNPDDRTVLRVRLPVYVQPGATLQLRLRWHARVPRTFARTGHRGDYYFMAHWFPKLGVFEPDGWSCHQFHATTEFYSDYGLYAVQITVPQGWVVGATGRLDQASRNVDGSQTLRFSQADVHGFAWTTSPDYVEYTRRFEQLGLPAVDVRLLMQPEHRDQVERHFAATFAALRSYGTWYGPYPYGHLTVIDPAYLSGAGGMEYPTLFTAGTRLFSPVGTDRPESVTVHEAGHQFWYGIVGNDEFELAWLDEGLNTFSTIRTLDENWVPPMLVRRFVPEPDRPHDASRGFIPVTFPDIRISRWTRRLDALRELQDGDRIADPTYRYAPNSAGALSYSKTALWLATLERRLGWDTLQRILHTFFERHRFTHPTAEDFLGVAVEIAGEPIRPFLEQVWGSSAVFDYAVLSVTSRPDRIEGFVDGSDGPVFQAAPSDDETAERYWSEVVVERRGAGVFPVDVLLVFDDGHEQRESWDGADRFRRIVVTRPARLHHAVVDPDRVLMLDVDRVNNGRLVESRSGLPAAKWASKWMLRLQDMLAGFAAFM